MTSTTLLRTMPVTWQKAPHRLLPRLAGAALALGVAYIHITDQGGFPGDKSPRYVGIGYYLLEAGALLTAVALIVGVGRHAPKAWALTVGVALGPLVGFVLSRGPGLPGYTDDRGNWTEPIGIASLVVEGTLLVLSASLLARSRRSAT